MKGAPPKRRSVLTVPEMDWAVESLVQWIEDIRPRISGEDNPALWCTERSSRIALGSVSNTFNQFRTELGLAVISGRYLETGSSSRRRPTRSRSRLG